MSGYADYAEANNSKYGVPYPVPLRLGTKENLQDYGRIVHDFDAEEVWITTWPQVGWRPIHHGTGRDGGTVGGIFKTAWKGDVITAQNEAVGGDYITGRLPVGVSTADRSYVLTREANYHPDGGQVFYPANGDAFVLVLALPGDDVKLEDFVAFYFDGSYGVQIKAGIWHQPLYPATCNQDAAQFIGKQGRVHACVVIDTVNEFGKFLKVPLKPELVTA